MGNKMKTGKGFSLIEVMVAVFVMAIGLLGLASLHGLTMKNNNNALYRTVAFQLANQMAEGMRANQGLTSGYLNAFAQGNGQSSQQSAVMSIGGEGENGGSAGGDSFGPSCFASTPCDAPSMVRYEVAAWLKSLEYQLPGGTGTITRDAASNLIAINVSWQERVAGQLQGEQKSHTLLVNL